MLMHKIVKDMLKRLKDGWKHPQPALNVLKQVAAFDDVSTLETLSDLLKFRQITLANKLIAKMGALAKQKISAYDINMYHTSDLI